MRWWRSERSRQLSAHRVRSGDPLPVSRIVTPEHERWAEALAIQQRYGEHAAMHIAERVGVLAIAGDEAGVARWREIAIRFDQLETGTLQ